MSQAKLFYYLYSVFSSTTSLLDNWLYPYKGLKVFLLAKNNTVLI